MDHSIVDTFSMNYSVISHLGEGGYGSVYLIEDNNNKQYAAKTILDSKVKSKTWSETRSEYVPNEVALWEGLTHDNLLSLLDVYHEEGKWILVMEYNAGYVDLYDYVAEHGVMEAEEAACLVKQLLDVVYYLILAGVDHRDIKDENILYNPSTKQIKLIDFGSASTLSSEPHTHFKGTEVYLPVEYFTKGYYHALPATVWAIGCLTYILLNGERPFRDTEEIRKSSLLWVEHVEGVERDFIIQCLAVEDRMGLSSMLYHPFLCQYAGDEVLL